MLLSSFLNRFSGVRKDLLHLRPNPLLFLRDPDFDPEWRFLLIFFSRCSFSILRRLLTLRAIFLCTESESGELLNFLFSGKACRVFLRTAARWCCFCEAALPDTIFLSRRRGLIFLFMDFFHFPKITVPLSSSIFRMHSGMESPLFSQLPVF